MELLIPKKTFDAGKGPRLLILGGVHGSERCGVDAITRLEAELESGLLQLQCGQLILMGPCNPDAFKRGERFIDRDLNRNVVHKSKPENYEDILANELVGPLSECDYLLDLHSATAKSEPFAFINGDTEEDWAFTQALGPTSIIHGWTKAYLQSKPDDPEKHITTTVCAASHGAKAVTFENGQNDDPATSDVAYETALRAMSHIGMINPLPLRPVAAPLVVDMVGVVFSDGTGDFAHQWKNLDVVKKGELIATRGNGDAIYAEKDMALVLPRHNAPAGAAWWYPANIMSYGYEPKPAPGLENG